MARSPLAPQSCELTKGRSRQVARSAIIVGAGVIGVCSAYALAKRGWSVTLIDRHAQPAMGTSKANGAQLSYCFTDALGSPATFAALPRLLAGQGGVSIRLGASPAYLGWLASFARNCTAARFRENTLAVLKLALESRTAMDALCKRHALEFSHAKADKVQLLYTPADRDRAVASIAWKSQSGCEQTIVERAGFAQIDPALCNVDEAVNAAIFTRSEMVGDARVFCENLLAVLTVEYDVAVWMGSDVERIERAEPTTRVRLSDGEVLEADCAVVCSGCDSNRLLAPLGLSVPVQPMKGYSFEMPPVAGSPLVSVTDAKRRLVITNLGDRLRVAGIAELGNASLQVEPDRVEMLRRAAMSCLPEAGDYAQTSGHWAGLRPTTPRSRPVIAQPQKGIAINTGHGALGWTLAMGSGERLAALID